MSLKEPQEYVIQMEGKHGFSAFHRLEAIPYMTTETQQWPSASRKN
jgi:hypothetical protein